MKEAILKRNAQKNIDRALADIVRDLAKLSGRDVPVTSLSEDTKSAASDTLTPPQLSSAKTVFIANACGEPLRDWKDNPVQPYNTLYATLQSWGRFKLALTPGEADSVFEVFVVPSEPLSLRLTILDARTQAVLWTLSQNIRGDQTLRGSFAEQKDLDKATVALVASVAKLVGQPDAKISVPPNPMAVPLPSKIRDFKKAFISRLREEPDSVENYMPGELYQEFVKDLLRGGHYELTLPKDAEVILEPAVSGSRVRLTVRDAQTGHVLWMFVRPARLSTLRGLRHTVVNSSTDNNYKDAIALVVDDLRRMAAPQGATKTAETR